MGITFEGGITDIFVGDVPVRFHVMALDLIMMTGDNIEFLFLAQEQHLHSIMLAFMVDHPIRSSSVVTLPRNITK